MEKWMLNMFGGPVAGVLIPWEEENDGPLPEFYVFGVPGAKAVYRKGDSMGTYLGDYLNWAYNYVEGEGGGHGGFRPHSASGHEHPQ